MINKSEMKQVLLEALKTGATFAELYFEDTHNIGIKVVKDTVENVDNGVLHGCALRLLKGVEETYGYTNDVSLEGLLTLARKLNKFYKGEQTVFDFEFKDLSNKKNVNISKLTYLEPLKVKTDYLKQATKGALEFDKSIIQAMGTGYEHVQNITVCNSNGVYNTDVRNNIRFSVSVVCENENGKQEASKNYGGNFGLDAYKDFDFYNMGREAAKQALTMLNAPQVKGGVYDVVIHNAFGGVIFHEACGHGLEASSVSRGLSVFAGKLGQKIASDVVTAIDDGTINNEWGSLNCDDEGTPTKKNVLIENGILKSYMVDYKNSLIMNTNVTGNSRRQSYKYIPTSRMTNTYIANGTSSFEEIISNTKNGIFAKELGGGSVNPSTGEFNFSVNEGYLIEDGKITTPVRGATLIGKGQEVLLNIDMVSNNQTFGYGMCGSSSGSIPACVGQPTIRVKGMTVGGNGGNN